LIYLQTGGDGREGTFVQYDLLIFGKQHQDGPAIWVGGKEERKIRELRPSTRVMRG
jgi:hypothetical protein